MISENNLVSDRVPALPQPSKPEAELLRTSGFGGWMSEKLVKVLKKSLFDNICINATSIVLKLSDFLTILSGNMHLICID